MAADVRSIKELRDFHAAFTTYRSLLMEALSGVDMEVRRAFEWLAEMLSTWQRRIRDCEDEVVQAKAELAARKFAGFDGKIPDCSLQEENLRRAKAKLEYCRDQVDKCRSWTAKLPKHVEETYEGSARRLGNALEIDVPNGLALLGRRITALESYADLRADFAPAPSAATLPTAPPTAVAPAAKPAGEGQ